MIFEKDVINLHFNRIRFDGVGGFCMAFSGGAGGENRPISINQWTFDNNASDEFFAAATAAGYYDGSRWSKGLISLTDMPGVQLHISDGRIELNKRLLPANGTTKCMILLMIPTEGNTASIHLENLSGYFQARDAGIVVKDLTCLCNAVFNNVLMNMLLNYTKPGLRRLVLIQSITVATALVIEPLVLPTSRPTNTGNESKVSLLMAG